MFYCVAGSVCLQHSAAPDQFQLVSVFLPVPAALLVFNTTGTDILAGGSNDFTANGHGLNAGLQIIGLEGQALINYQGINFSDFAFLTPT